MSGMSAGKKMKLDSEYVKQASLQQMDLASGVVRVQVQMKEKYYYELVSQMTGVPIQGEYDLMRALKELSAMKHEYSRVQSAMEAVRGSGYGVVIPEKEEIVLDDPVVIRQGSKFGVKIRSTSPSIHMIRANIETEIAPIVGTEQQAEDLIAYIRGKRPAAGGDLADKYFRKIGGAAGGGRDPDQDRPDHGGKPGEASGIHAEDRQ